MTTARSVWTALSTAARPFGDVYTGYMLRHHLRFLVLTFVVILAAVTAINVSGEIGRVWAEGKAGGDIVALQRTALYVWCRLLDNGSQVFAISFLLGLVWAETAHAFGGRLLMVRLVGRSFLHRSTALTILCALAVPTGLALDNVIRPWAFMTLSHEGLGEYGWTYAAARAPVRRWYAFGDVVVRVVMHDAPDPVFEDAVLYDFDANGDLAAVATAEAILPPGPDRPTWTLRGATRWRIGDPADPAFGMPAARQRPGAEVPVQALGFAISPLWLRYREIEPKYVPITDLWRLSRDPDLPANRPKYGPWLAIRATQAFTLGLIGLMVGAVFALALDRRGLIVAVGAALLTAYCGYFLSRISALMVENTTTAPFAAASVLPVAAAIGLWHLIRHLRRRERAPRGLVGG